MLNYITIPYVLFDHRSVFYSAHNPSNLVFASPWNFVHQDSLYLSLWSYLLLFSDNKPTLLSATVIANCNNRYGYAHFLELSSYLYLESLLGILPVSHEYCCCMTMNMINTPFVSILQRIFMIKRLKTLEVIWSFYQLLSLPLPSSNMRMFHTILISI